MFPQVRELRSEAVHPANRVFARIQCQIQCQTYRTGRVPQPTNRGGLRLVEQAPYRRFRSPPSGNSESRS